MYSRFSAMIRSTSSLVNAEAAYDTTSASERRGLFITARATILSWSRERICRRSLFPLPASSPLSAPRLLPWLGDCFFSDGRWNFLVLGDGHGELAPSRSDRPQIGGIPEHFRQRDLDLDDLVLPVGIPSQHAPTTPVGGPDDVADVLLGDDDLHLDDGLQKDRLGFGGRLFERE